MKKVKVKRHDTNRDGGTTVYIDQEGRLYYQWWPTKKVYNQYPFPHGSVGMNNIPPPYVGEISIELDIVENF